MERPLCRTREKHPWIHNTSVTRVFAFIDLLFGENSRTASSYIIIILASMNSWNSLICIFEPATHYYVARRVFHVVYTSPSGFADYSRSTGIRHVAVTHALNRRRVTSGVPNLRRTLPARTPLESSRDASFTYARKKYFFPFFSLSFSSFIFYFFS